MYKFMRRVQQAVPLSIQPSDHHSLGVPSNGHLSHVISVNRVNQTVF